MEQDGNLKQFYYLKNIGGIKWQSIEKKPIIIEAIQYDGENVNEIFEFTNNLAYIVCEEDLMVIPTLEGNHIANIGDYIIKGIKGEFYPCKPEIFKSTYEGLNEETK